MPEIQQYAPHAVYVARKGEVNAWDNEDFVRTVRSTGKKTLVMAGVWTSVCVMFPTLDAKLPDTRSMRSWMRLAIRARWQAGRRLLALLKKA